MKSAKDITDYAKSVVLKERDGLNALARSICESSLPQAIEIIINTKSYVVVVGVGKSGHIGQKISASFASTGTPAFFLHPTEASHGDLGMITEGCALLVLSNSGESRELVDVLNYANKESVPVIAMTSRPQSTLAKAATVSLVFPEVEEACPNGLAPTTSTTNTLALGDALVVSVMKTRGFTSEEFGRRHPGGKLGLRLQTVNDWITRNTTQNPLIPLTAAMQETVLAITEGGYGCVGVTNDKGKLIGIVTDGDLRRAMTSDFFDKSAKDIMTADPFSISLDATMGAVIDSFTERRIANAFVVENGTPLALIDLKTLLAAGYV